MIRSITLIAIISLAGLSACDTSSPAGMSNDAVLATRGVFIVNEGGFQKATASLSFYVPDSQKIYNDVFRTANGRGLGDVANDMAIGDDRAFIVVNNSNKIEVIAPSDQRSLGTISLPGNGPYKIALYSPTKGYVTNYSKNSVTVFNPSTLEVGAEIAVGNYPKGILAYNDRIYVCNSGDFAADSTVSVINPFTNTVVKTIVVGPSPNEIEGDDQGDLFVRCYGYSDWTDPSKDLPGSIAVIDGGSNTVTSVIDLPLDVYGHPGKMSLSNDGYGYVVVRTGIAKFSTGSREVVRNPFIAIDAYSIAVDDVSGHLYIGDAKNFVQNGRMLVYDKDAVLLDSATVGIIPGTFAFLY